MAFPDTSVLDDFNDTDTDPLNGNGIWSSTTVWNFSDQTIQRLSNKAEKSGGADHGSIMTTATYDSSSNPVEAGHTNMGIDSASFFTVWLNIQNADTASVDMYEANFTTVATGAWNLSRRDNESETSLDSGTQSVSAGDGFGIKNDNGELEFWYYNGTSWSMLGSASNETDYTSGNIGFSMQKGSGDNIDDFFGGEVSAANTRRYLQTVLGVG